MLGNVFDYLNFYDCGYLIKVEDFLFLTIKFVVWMYILYYMLG